MSIKEKKMKKKKKTAKKERAGKLEYWVPIYSNGNVIGYAAVKLDKKG